MKKTSRQIQKEKTKEMLLKTAYNLFSEKGIRNTHMSDIAQTAGVSHGTVFLHFQTQDLLVEEVIETYCGKIASRTHELSISCDSLQQILTAHLEGIMEFEPFYTKLVIENRFLPSVARDAWINLQSAISFHFSKTVERDPGLRATNVPLNLLFNMWIGLVHYYLANGDLFAPEGNVISRYGKSLIENYLKMIQNDTK